MKYIILFLGVVYLLGYDVGKFLAVCAIIEGIALILLDICKRLGWDD